MKMIQSLRALLKDQIFKNFSSLAIIQATNYILPLITMPFILRAIGTEKFGVVSFAQAFFTYLIIFTDYSFNITATSSVAVNKENKKELSEIVSRTLILKLLLGIAAFLLLILLINYVPKFSKERNLYLWGFLVPLGQILMPVWFFQGIEKMSYLTILNFCAKSFFTISVFFLITTPNDYEIILVLTGLGNVISGIIGIIIMISAFKINIRRCSLTTLITLLREGLHIFFSNFLTNIYVNSNIFILSLFASDKTIGIYSIAEKLFLAIRGLLVVFYQAIFPQVYLLSKNGGTEALKKFYKRNFIPFLWLVVFISLFFIIFSNQIIYFFLGQENSDASILLKLFSIVPIVITVNIPFNQFLLVYNFKKLFFAVVLLSAMLNIASNLFLSSKMSSIGTVYSIILTEVFYMISVMLIVFQLKKNIQ